MPLQTYYASICSILAKTINLQADPPLISRSGLRLNSERVLRINVKNPVITADSDTMAAHVARDDEVPISGSDASLVVRTYLLLVSAMSAG